MTMGEATNHCINVFTKCLIQIVTIHVAVGRSRNGNQCLFWGHVLVSTDICIVKERVY